MNQLAKKNIVFGILVTSFYTPIVFFLMGLPMILQVKGFDPSTIGIFQALGLPMVIKFLLSPPVDQIVFETNHYKKWIVFTGIFYVLFLFGVSFVSLEDNIYLVFGVIFCTTLVATFLDIPLNALAIKVFHKDERMSAGSYKMSAYFAAGLLGGGVFLLVFNRLGWQNTFVIIALFVLVSLLALYFIHESDEKIEEQKVSLKTLITFFKQENIGIWIFVLMFYFAFISAIWVFMKPYLISKGITPDEVAFYVGVYGSIVGFIGGVVASFVGKIYSKKTILILFGVFNILSALILVMIEYFDMLNFIFLMSIVTIASTAIAFSSAIIFSLIMDYSRSSSKAIDYAIQSSLFSLMRIFSAIIAGVFVSNLGYTSMFVFESLAMFFVVFVIYRFYIK
ncbi:MFS transporter [Candidatus Marinarcus aquaticus]|uniref:MFS transporter n=1 Tax=Candidatus Marinarcus aquaticus TaxID=2044504 RepID=A0A4Q0XRF2_9BACT|nr:MFS transporter [Candidatus Marinarcus aquaticus]RXJ57647.1 MFS transporter [Candidatus Marinarcus aquaticus]